MITTTFKNLFNLFLGIIVGILLHYLLYRYSIPAKAFIYVAF